MIQVFGVTVGTNVITGALLDMTDFVLVASILPILGIPFDIVGQIIDVAGVCFWYLKTRSFVGLLPAIELIPSGILDLLPSNLMIGYYLDNHKGEKT